MSAADGRITFDTKINTKGIKDGMKGAEAQVKEGSKEICTHFDSIGNSRKKLGAMIGSVFAIRELVRFGKEAIQLASDLQEVQNVVDVTFGNMSEAVNEFARNAIEQFGLSELSAKQYSSTMGAMLKSMGFSTKQAAEMSMTLTGLAGDLASFYNQFKLPEDVKVEGVRLAKSKQGEWSVQADLGEKGLTSKHILSWNDKQALFNSKTATKEQLAARYLNNEIKDMAHSEKVSAKKGYKM